MKSDFICVHLGARAHYLIPQSLQANGNLDRLITDTWISSRVLRSVCRKIPVRLVKSFSNRYSKAVPSQKVHSFGFLFALIEIYIRIRYKKYWDQILVRNMLFQRFSLSIFNKNTADSVVLGVSYTSLKIFQKAKQRKQKTILFQVDPGIVDEEIVADVVKRNQAKFGTSWEKAPEVYWKNWYEECSLADTIIVNSDFSSKALEKAGICGNKIKVLPLPFQLEEKHLRFERSFAEKFDFHRPLRCLFLGRISLRKGIHLIIEVAERLKDYPVEFILVGESEVDETLFQLPNVAYKGVVTREETDRFYREADVFLFSTFSDGFGLTQLEAMAWQLPVIASKYCGEVVINGHNGISLSECSSDAITKIIIHLLSNPQSIAGLSSNCLGAVRLYSMERFAEDMSTFA